MNNFYCHIPIPQQKMRKCYFLFSQIQIPTSMKIILKYPLLFSLPAGIISRNIIFNNVTIPQLPPKSFPSSLNIISFLNCDIGIIASLAFKGKTLQQIRFQDSRIQLIKSSAFDEEILINNSWTVEGSKIGEIQERGIESSITQMSWTESEVGKLGSYSMSGIIPNATFTRNTFKQVSRNGLTLKDWTSLSFLNNSFEEVESSGIDLTQHAAQFNFAQIIGNTWKGTGTDFIKVGPSSPTPFTNVLDNRILELCTCSSPLFIPQVTLNGSSFWFQEQIWNNSLCLTTPKAATCLGRADPSDTFVSYNDWTLLCSESTFLCINELSEVTEDVVPTHAPPLAGKLRILTIIIGTVGLAIVIALLIVLCVYVCRREKSRDKKDDAQRPKPSRLIPSNQVTHNHNGCNHAYTGISNKVPGSIPSQNTSAIRPRSTLFEDVEMEDKGVQTMPSELSTEVLEGLREKLTDPESFWDAKETIDHLYDLIHVREDGVPSPPDVTVLPSAAALEKGKVQSTRSTSTTNKDFQNLNPSHSIAAAQRCQALAPRYAQIRSKPKSAVLAEYRNPSASPSNIYSELSQQEREFQAQNGHADMNPEIGHSLLTPNCSHPEMCDYTEPKDVQTHVYAELNSFPTRSTHSGPSFPHTHATFCVQRARPIGRLTTPPTVPVQDKKTAQGTEASSSPSCQQRPLPSIPPPFSTSTLK